jgi:phage/plasmid-like protein (TIGR03299 family)
MAHRIEDTDGLFVVREPAWHGLGTVLDHTPSREEAQQIAHPWEPVDETLYRQVVTVHAHDKDCWINVEGPASQPPSLVCGLEEGPSTHFEAIEGFVGKARSDIGTLLGVTSDTYQSIRNAEMYDIAEALEKSFGDAPSPVLYETGGSLMGGKKVWLLIRLAEPLKVKGDPYGDTIMYYALQNAHDGLGSFRGQATGTRIVCDNTSQMADLDARARGTEFVFRHTRNVQERIEQAKQALAGWREGIETWNQLAEHYVTLPVSEQGRELFLEQFVPMPAANVISDRVRNNIEEARAHIRKILVSPTCEGIQHTPWGLLQASVEYSQHVRRANTKETLFKRAYLDRSSLVESARDLALEVVG